MVRLLHVTDLHYRLEWFDWVARRAPEFDGVCLSGDLVDLAPGPVSVARQMAWVRRWLRSLPVPVVVASGRHDTVWCEKEARDRAEWLEEFGDGGVREVGGLRIGAMPWSGVPPEAVDVLVTHAPPAGLEVAEGDDDCREGDRLLVNDLRFSAPPPRLVLCGQVHRPRHWFSLLPAARGVVAVFNPGRGEDTRMPHHVDLDLRAGVADHWPTGGRLELAEGWELAGLR